MELAAYFSDPIDTLSAYNPLFFTHPESYLAEFYKQTCLELAKLKPQEHTFALAGLFQTAPTEIQSLEGLKQALNLAYEHRAPSIYLLPEPLLERRFMESKGKTAFIGTQNPFPDMPVHIGALEFMQDEPSDRKIRIGQLRQHGVPDIEPILRNCHTVLVDLHSMQSDTCPFGIEPEILCQLFFYLGSSGGTAEVALVQEPGQTGRQSAHKVAVALWYFLKGLDFRLPNQQPTLEECVSYVIPDPQSNESFVFYKEKRVDRWWFGYADSPTWIACSETDYKSCLNGSPPSHLLAT